MSWKGLRRWCGRFFEVQENLTKTKMRTLFTLLITIWGSSIGAQIIEDVKFLKPATAAHTVDLEIYEMAEIGIKLPTDLVSKFKKGSTRNPYNEKDIKIFAELFDATSTAPIRIYQGFYLQEFEVTATGQADSNNPKQSDFPFRIRFAPEQVGIYSLKIRFQNQFRDTEDYSKIFSVNVISSSQNNQGYLTFENGQYLGFSSDSNSTFFPVGSGLSYYKYNSLPDQHDWNFPTGGHADYSSTTIKDFRNLLTEFSDNGGNFIRMMLLPYNFGIEWDWQWDGSSDGAQIGYHNYQYRAQDFDEILQICKEKNIYIMLSLFTYEIWRAGDPDFHATYNWENNPYKTIENVDAPIDFFRNEHAKELTKRKIRYVMSRWGYHPNLAAIQITAEMDHSISFYIGNRQLIKDWNVEMASLVKQLAPTKLITNSTGNYLEGERIYDSDLYDFACYHYYTHSKKSGYEHNRVSQLFAQSEAIGIPFIAGELGSTNRACSPTNCYQPHNPTTHNFIWATSFSGAFGTGLMYVWEQVMLYPRAKSVNHLKPLKTFFENQNLNDYQWNPISTQCEGADCLPRNWPYLDCTFLPDLVSIKTNSQTESSNVEAFGLRSTGNEKLIGWVHNMNNYWYNLPCNKVEDEVLCGPNYLNVDPIENITMQIPNLNPDDMYKVRWFSTHPWFDLDGNGTDNLEGGVITRSSFDEFSTTFSVNKNGVLKIRVPNLMTLNPELNTTEEWAPDYAFEITKISSATASTQKNLNFKCFPNPNDGEHLFVQFQSSAEEDYMLYIYDSLGKLIENKILNAPPGMSRNLVCIDSQMPGLLFIVLKSKNKIIATQKMIFN